ncbi:hypothetical protein SAMN02746089_02014 [Caldanaerobius fijiensis DSM 17918]|uniref:DUF4129 domain-containing protein n=1 Tax=Caldanaerobius fijiensis DSM 17918 TaxID=1121256 RepID=A0A1M5C279_9THEO|nr:hypothetical protein [Caldanaerobius fijiensis]SHF48873.1 hypothetical protein SAMN02746089_02014 [Caldanaerobius fijiensis DSM 17918]
MKKRNLFEILYIVPEIILIFFILNKFYHTLDAAIYTIVIIYTFILMQLLYYKFIPMYFLALFFLPVLVIWPTSLGDLGRLTAIPIFEILAIARFYFFFKGLRYIKYNNTYFIIESIIIIVLSLIFTRSALIYYAILLKLMLLIENNQGYSIEEKADLKDVLFIIFNFVVLIFTPLFNVIGKGLYGGLKAIYDLIDELIYYPAYYIGLLISMILPKITPKGLERLLQLGKGMPDNKVLQREQVRRVIEGNTTVRYIVYAIGIIAIAAIVYVLIKKFLNLGIHREREDIEYEQDVISIKPEPKRDLSNLPPIRRMYVNIIMAAIKKGYEFKNSSTSRDLIVFLRRIIPQASLLVDVNKIYELERYAQEKQDESKFEDIYKKLMQQLR